MRSIGMKWFRVQGVLVPQSPLTGRMLASHVSPHITVHTLHNYHEACTLEEVETGEDPNWFGNTSWDF